MSELFPAITSDDWKRSIADARSEPNKAVEQIHAEEVRRGLRIEVHFSSGGRSTLTRVEYEALKLSGMLWEFHADAPLDWPAPMPNKPSD